MYMHSYASPCLCVPEQLEQGLFEACKWEETHRSNIAWHDAQAQRALLVVSKHACCMVAALDDHDRVCAPLNVILYTPLCQVVANGWRRIINGNFASNFSAVVMESVMSPRRWKLAFSSKLLQVHRHILPQCTCVNIHVKLQNSGMGCVQFCLTALILSTMA